MSNNIYDVAKKANVSLATVSRVINKPNLVKESTRTKVENIIKELGYKPNVIAQGLASKKSTSIGVVVPNILRASVAEMMDSITLFAKKFGYRITVFTLKSSVGKIEDVIKDILATQIDGIIYINDKIGKEEEKELSNAPIPTVLTNSLYEGSDLHNCVIDYYEAAYEATEVLINEGRKNIVLISSTGNYTIDKYKEQGYKDAISKRNMKPLICRASGNLEKGYKIYKDFLSDNKVDGVLGVRDSMVITFMNALLNTTKLKVPEDVSLIGFQNTRYSRLIRPQLTCIDASLDKIGSTSIEILEKLMRNIEDESLKKENVVKHKMIFRETTLNKN